MARGCEFSWLLIQRIVPHRPQLLHQFFGNVVKAPQRLEMLARKSLREFPYDTVKFDLSRPARNVVSA